RDNNDHLLGLAAHTTTPDIASGGLTSLSYQDLPMQGFHEFKYNAIPLTLSIGKDDGVQAFALADPSAGGPRHTDVQITLQDDPENPDVPKVVSGSFTITGKATVNGQPFDGTLLAGDVKELGYRVTQNNAEFEVRLDAMSGALTKGEHRQVEPG